MKYHEQLKHPLWQKKRLEVMEHYDFQCQECGSEDDTLNVHHHFYKRGAMIWDYDIDELTCLCEKCHKDVHAIDEKIKQSLSFLSINNKMQILGYVDSQYLPYFGCDDVNYKAGYADGIKGLEVDRLLNFF